MREISLLTGRDARMIFFIWFIIVLFLPWNGGDLPAPGTLVDTDSYMRLVELERLWNGGGWFDHTNMRMNAPEGVTLHWTRPLDLVLIALAAPLMIFMEARDAFYWAGYFISPLFLLLTGWTVFAGAAAFGRPHAGLLASAMLFFPSSAAMYATAGHADHHTFLLFLAALTAVSSIRLLTTPGNVKHSRSLGIALGLGLWVSPEFLIVIAPMLGGLLLAWLRDRKLADAARSVSRFFLLVVLAGFISVGGIQELPAVSYDRISLVHVWLAGMHWLMWEVVSRTADSRSGAVAPVAVAAIVLAGGIAAWFPGFVQGPAWHVPAEARELWLERVNEMKPHSLTSIEGWRNFLGLHNSLTFIVAGLLVWLGVRRKIESRTVPLVCTFVFVTLMGFMHLRLTQYSVPLACILVAPWARDLMEWLSGASASGKKKAMVGAAMVLGLFGPALTGYLLPEAKDTSQAVSDSKPDPEAIAQESRCLAGNVLSKLRSDDPQIVMANVDAGPELVWLTDHSSVAGPYHRGHAGITTSIKVFGGATEAEAAALVRESGAGLLLYCPDMATGVWAGHDRKGNAAFATLLDSPETPDWLEPLVVEPVQEKQGQLYRINRQALLSSLNM